MYRNRPAASGTRLFYLLLIGALIAIGAPATRANETSDNESKFPAWDEVTKDHKKLEGLLDLYYDEDQQSLLIELGSGDLDQDFLMPISVARGAGNLIMGGDTLNFGNQWIVQFKRVADKILVVRPNVYVRAEDGSPQADAVKVSHTDSVILAVAIRSEKGGSVLINAADIFMTDLAQVGLSPDRERSSWYAVKSFDDNVVIQVSAVGSLGGGFFFFFGGTSDIPDMRGVQAVVHYGLSKAPSGSSYKPRVADDRVGHFLSVVKDFSTDNDRTAYVRYVTRWHLEKSDSSAEMSPPKKPIIFWIERTVPREYRPYVKAGILEWNKAFEKVGFIDAIQVRDQLDADQFDPEDIRFNTFRWITTSVPFAMGPSRTNPRTGQILDADILFDESFVRYWREEYLTTAGLPAGLKLLQGRQSQQAWFKQHAHDIPWLVLAAPQLRQIMRDPRAAELLQAHDHLHLPAPPSLLGGGLASHERCMLGPGINRQLALLSTVLESSGEAEPGGKVPLEFIGQAIKEVTMHEVGHTLGLRHNFKASTMLSLEECNDPDITSERGMAGSVMDYLPANFALEGEQQGHYFSQTIGPYDYWAVEYAYKPISGDEEKELAKIASRVAEPDLAFGTDEDMWGNPDPRINTYDLGDPLDYAQQRTALVEQHLKSLAERVVAEGEGWQRARSAFGMLMSELSNASFLASQYIGAEYTYRDHKGDPNARTPYEPIPAAKQREAMAFLGEHILQEDAFSFSPALLKRLAPTYWSSGGDEGYPVYDTVLGVQRIVLSRFMSGGVLRSLQNIELHAEEEQDVLRMPEVFDVLSAAIWSELPDEAGGEESEPTPIRISTIRRNLQREHYRRLADMVLGSGSSSDLYDLLYYGFSSSAPPDARALARMHLGELHRRVQLALGDQFDLDDYSRAHLMELDQGIEKVLSADLQARGL